MTEHKRNRLAAFGFDKKLTLLKEVFKAIRACLNLDSSAREYGIKLNGSLMSVAWYAGWCVDY